MSPLVLGHRHGPPVFVDVEQLLIDFLTPRLAPAPIRTIVPNPRPALFLRLWRNGGPAVNRVLDAPLVTIEGWGTDSGEASRITAEARAYILNDHRAMRYVRRVTEITGVYSTPDPETDTPRYRFTVQLHVRRPRT